MARSTSRFRVAAVLLTLSLLAALLPVQGTAHSDELESVSATEHCPHDGTGSGSPDNAINKTDHTKERDGVNIVWGEDPGKLTITNKSGKTAIITWCAKGGANFDNGSMIVGEQVWTLEDGESRSQTFGTEVSYFVLYKIDFLEPPDETYSVELVKEWEIAADPGDRWDEDDADFSLSAVPDSGLEDGDTFTVTEDITSVSDGCEVTDTTGVGAQTLDADLADDNDVVTHTVTNTVTCEPDVSLVEEPLDPVDRVDPDDPVDPVDPDAPSVDPDDPTVAIVEDDDLLTPTRIDAGGGGLAGSTGLSLQALLASLLALAGAAFGVSGWRARRQSNTVA